MQGQLAPAAKIASTVTITIVWRVCMGGSASPLMMENPLPPMPAAATVSAATCTHALLRLPDATLIETLTQLPSPPAETLPALTALVTLLQQLRSPQSDPPSLTPAALLPYVMDEAYDLLEALRPPAVALEVSTVPPVGLVRLDALSPQLLWCVARSAYPTLQLLEGTPARICAANGAWQAGILRLAVILELTAADTRVAIDLALGSDPHDSIPSDWLIQLDQGSDLQVVGDMGLGTERSLLDLDSTLTVIRQQLQRTQPTLQSWLEGIPVEWLVAGSDWRSGQVRLQLELSFLPPLPEPLSSPTTRLTPIEAELLDEQELAAEGEALPCAPTASDMMPIIVVEMPRSPIISTTLIRLARVEDHQQFAQLALQQELGQCLQHFGGRVITEPVESLLLPLVQSVSQLTEAALTPTLPPVCLQQPELLMDELLPKLLWQVTRSSFAVMTGLAGIACTLLEPTAAWQTGLLRLMVVLELQTQDDQWWIDLATGRLLPDQSWQLAPGAIAQFSAAAPHWVAVADFQSQLEQAIFTAAPELAELSRGLEIDWLTMAHEWQPGRLQLHLGCEFLSDLA